LLSLCFPCFSLLLPLENPCISLNSFLRIGTFQWVARVERGKNFNSPPVAAPLTFGVFGQAAVRRVLPAPSMPASLCAACIAFWKTEANPTFSTGAAEGV
jgi:hypothetical protein